MFHNTYCTDGPDARFLWRPADPVHRTPPPQTPAKTRDTETESQSERNHQTQHFISINRDSQQTPHAKPVCFHALVSFDVHIMSSVRLVGKNTYLRVHIIALYLFASVHFNYNKIFKEFFLHFRCTCIHQTLELYSSLYSDDFYWGVCLYIIHTDLCNILPLKTWWKCICLKAVSFFLHFSCTYIHQTLQFYSSLYSEGFYWGVCLYIIHTDLYNILPLKTWWKCICLKAVSFFLHFSCTYIHQTLQFYSSLYSEGFYWGVCLYIIHTDLYNILPLKTWWKCICLKAVSFYLHFSSTYIHQTLQFYSSLYSEGFYWGVCSYIIHTDLYNTLFLQTWRQCIHLKSVSFYLHLYILSKATYINQNESFIPLYILKVFNEGFIHLILYNGLLPKTWWFFFCLLTVFSDLWSDKKRYSNSPLEKKTFNSNITYVWT